jgi:hypothetical protein
VSSKVAAGSTHLCEPEQGAGQFGGAQGLLVDQLLAPAMPAEFKEKRAAGAFCFALAAALGWVMS